jgi:multicomponent Na+:H+ antiporter subunit E
LPALLALLLRLPGQVLVAGAVVARRALDPRVAVRPGLVAYASCLPAGLARDGFLALASLMPGTLPAGEDADGRVLVHALDLGQPVTEDMAREEAGFARAVGADG